MGPTIPTTSYHQLGIEGDMGIWTWEPERLELEGSGTSGTEIEERKKRKGVPVT
jgi:hypothetical protein